MSAKEIVQVLEQRRAGEASLLSAYGSQAPVTVQRIEELLVPRLEQNSMYMYIWQRFYALPAEASNLLVQVVNDLLEADAALAQQMEELLGRLQVRDEPF